MDQLLDEKFYEAAKPNSWAEKVLVVARNAIYADFNRRMQPTRNTSILDVGVSDVVNDGANVLERKYPYPENITACGLGTASEFQLAYPECKYVQIKANKQLPFDDGQFDVATSNAVLEHVGSFDSQVSFVSELCRVARKVFISVPNKYFPVEHHTSIPFFHYDETLFNVACGFTNKEYWANEDNLILMSRKLLWRLAASQGNMSATVGYTGLLLGPFSSNLYLSMD